MRSKREHHEKSTLDRKPKRLKNVDSIKSAFIFVLGSQKSIFPDCPILNQIKLFSKCEELRPVVVVVRSLVVTDADISEFLV